MGGLSEETAFYTQVRISGDGTKNTTRMAFRKLEESDAHTKRSRNDRTAMVDS